jgi:hypothetical protein
MIVTDRTREALRCRRIRRDLIAAGFEEVADGGGHLWELHRELHRGFGTDHMITAVAIAPEGKSLFIKTGGKN